LVPGSRDVVNALAVKPPQEDNDDEITEFDAWYLVGVDGVINGLAVCEYT
jgi:hypothetical protein